MALPFFFKEDISLSSTQIILDEPTSKHVIQVLRMQNGEHLQLTNGKGDLLTCEIIDDNRKKCVVNKIRNLKIQNSKSQITIAISLLKNTTRFEWFLEKATEIGVTQIIPLICGRTEKTAFKFERLNSILISAMLQSQQCWLPVLQQPIKFDDALKDLDSELNMIAYCGEGEKLTIPKLLSKHPSKSLSILIGPEGDFTEEEIKYADTMQCFYITLGKTRLRTETAGVVAATLLNK